MTSWESWELAPEAGRPEALAALLRVLAARGKALNRDAPTMPAVPKQVRARRDR